MSQSIHSDSDAPIGAAGNSDDEPGAKRHRPAHSNIDFSDGPPLLVAIIGDQSDTIRFSKLVGSELDVLDAARAQAGLVPTASMSRPDARHLPTHHASLVGVAIVRAWRFVLPGREVSNESKMLMAHLRKGRDARTAMGFLEYPVLRAAYFSAPIAIERIVPNGSDLGAQWVSMSGDPRVQLELPSSPGTCQSLRDWLTASTATFHLPFLKCIVWHQWLPLAEVFVRSAWPAEVVGVVQRDRKKVRLQARIPTRKLERQYFRHISSASLDVVEVSATCPMREVRTNKNQRQRGAKAFDFHHLVNAIRAAHHSLSSRHLGTTVESSLHYAMPNNNEGQSLARGLKADGFEHPSRPTMDRALVRFDVAAMVVNRARYAREGPFWRYINWDASPIHGVEVFCTHEEVIPRRCVEGKTFAEIDFNDMEERNLPLNTLGQGSSVSWTR
jgi:hypothetical protein